MIVNLLCAAMLGGLIGGAELVACYRDRPGQAVLSPSGLMYVFVNAVAALIALVAIDATGFQFGLPDSAPLVSLYVVQVVTAGLGSAALMRTSFTLAQDRGINTGPISLLHGVLKIVDAAMARKRALSRLSGNELEGLSFARDHAALAQLACHALPRFDLAEAQRLGELAADLLARDDLTDADKLDCFGLELSWLVGERALAKAAARLRTRPEPAGPPREETRDEPDERPLPGPREWWRTDDGHGPAAPPAESPAGTSAEPPAEPPAAVGPAAAAPAPPRRSPLPAGPPRSRGALARETRLAARAGRPGPAEEAGEPGSPAKTWGGPDRSMLETRADIRRPPAEASEPRQASAAPVRRPLRRSRSAS
ncbi:MAG TPA: hypothetical protein VFU43_25600 [Streptosporangiaceae bacterium]|nr:hypothetical protein [Streptosporangiaceae bacterium]